MEFLLVHGGDGFLCLFRLAELDIRKAAGSAVTVALELARLDLTELGELGKDVLLRGLLTQVAHNHVRFGVLRKITLTV